MLNKISATIRQFYLCCGYFQLQDAVSVIIWNLNIEKRKMHLKF